MSPATYQTIKLTKGKHSSPDEGACVMELASLLADEPFTDHPASVCPVIGSFLRAYNDSIDDELRQDLYGYASRVVGTRGPLNVQRQRVERLTDWAMEMHRRHWTSRYLPLARLRMSGLKRQPSAHAVGTFAVRAIPKHTHETHTSVLQLLDSLVALTASPQPPAVPDLAEELPRALYPVA